MGLYKVSKKHFHIPNRSQWKTYQKKKKRKKKKT